MLGADKDLADAEFLEAINAWWRAAFNSSNVLLYTMYSDLEKVFVG